MLDASGVYALSAAVHAVALLGSIVWVRRIPEGTRRYYYPVVGVIGLATVTTAVMAAGLGYVTVGGSELDLPRVVDDLIAYPVLWIVAALLADVSRRTLAIVGGVAMVQVVAFNGASVLGGLVGLVGLATVVVGHGVMAYLFLGPIWERAAGIPDKQRLLHWKARNLLLFLIGMLIAFALLSVAAVFDGFVTAALSEYVGLLIRLGFAGFLFVNRDAIVPDEMRGFGADDVTPTAGSD